MNKFDVRKLALAGILMGLVVLGILVLHINIGSGYIHVADSFMLLSASLGPVYGLLVSGLGGGIADILAGYAAYVPWTFLINGVQAVLMAFSLKKMSSMNGKMFFILGFVVSVVTVVPGYYLTDVIMYGNWTAPLFPALMNILQVGVGSAVGAILYGPYQQISRKFQ